MCLSELFSALLILVPHGSARPRVGIDAPRYLRHRAGIKQPPRTRSHSSSDRAHHSINTLLKYAPLSKNKKSCIMFTPIHTTFRKKKPKKTLPLGLPNPWPSSRMSGFSLAPANGEQGPTLLREVTGRTASILGEFVRCCSGQFSLGRGSRLVGRRADPVA